MWLPPFVEELRHERYRPNLLSGVISGYLIALTFAGLAAAAAASNASPYGGEFAWIVVAKLVTNTASWIAIHRRWRFALELMTLNITADVLCMTAAIYFTGGPASPLFAIYVLEVGVMALLSNLGTTLLTSAGILVSYGTMCVLISIGVLAEPELLWMRVPSAPQIVIIMTYATFAIGVPTFFTARILRRLGQRERALEARTSELIEAGQQKSVFLASVTHELRTPIHGVSGMAELIAGGVYGPTTDKQRDAAQSIQKSAQSLLQLVDDLLALVKAEVGKVEVQPTAFQVSELVEQVTASVAWMVTTKRVTLSADLVDATVRSDRRLLGHILVNLVANAVKFTPEGGRIELRARVAGQQLVFAVSDTGIGIAADDRQRIFEAFRQLDGSDERAYGGVGLGLALVKRLTEVLGGTVTVDSVVGHGSTFTVAVPALVSRGTGDDVELTAQG